MDPNGGKTIFKIVQLVRKFYTLIGKKRAHGFFYRFETRFPSIIYPLRRGGGRGRRGNSHRWTISGPIPFETGIDREMRQDGEGEGEKFSKVFPRETERK